MTLKPTLVIVHGSWHSPAHLEPLLTQLRAHEYACVPVSLPSTQPANEFPKSLSDDTAAVRNAVHLELEAGKDVVVIAHSYGGVPAANALAGLDSRSRGPNTSSVTALVFLCAALIPPKTSFINALGGSPWPIHDFRDSGSKEFCWVGPPGPGYYFYNDLPVAEAVKWEAELRPQSWRAYEEKTGEEMGYLRIESWYLFCELDNAIPIAVQKGMVEATTKAGGLFAEERCREIRSGHVPFLSRVEETAEFVLRAAGRHW